MVNQHILVVNTGSSSVKYQVTSLPALKMQLSGQVEGIGSSSVHRLISKTGEVTETNPLQADNHQAALKAILEQLKTQAFNVTAVVHRVVHGGDKFTAPVLIDNAVINTLNQLKPLAPQHLDNNLLGMKICQQQLPDAKQIAVFDTAFHADLPELVYRYPVPENWLKDYGIRRYGFHGLSYQYVLTRLAQKLERPETELNVIAFHLGNGASVCAIEQGKSRETSMGLTPLEGLMMGTRSGDIDPAIPLLIQQFTGQSTADIEHRLNFESGLQAICDEHDMVKLQQRAEQGDKPAQLALSMYIHRLRKYLGAYVAVLGQVDAVIFTGGIGGHSAEIRQATCENLALLGIQIDAKKNQQSMKQPVVPIHHDNSLIPVYVIKTNEEWQMAQAAMQLIMAK